MAPIYQGEFTVEQAEAMTKLGFPLTEVRQKESPIIQIAEIDKRDWIIVPAGTKYNASQKDFQISPARIARHPALEEAAEKLGLNYENSSGDSLGREFIGNNTWANSLRLARSIGSHTPTMEEQRGFLHLLLDGSQEKTEVYTNSGKLTSQDCRKFYEDIVAENLWRAEYIDADFKVKDGVLYLNQNHIFDEVGNIISFDSQALSKYSLMKDKKISLENFLNEKHTKQGFPRKSTRSGSFIFLYPLSDNNSVARFMANYDYAYLRCDKSPLASVSHLGVRAAEQRE